MVKLKTKPLLAVSAAVIVIAGGYTAYHFMHASNKPHRATSSAPAKAAPIDPSSVLHSESTYVNTHTTVSLRGSIIQNGPNYYLMGATQPGTKSSAAVQLDFSKTSVNPAQYALNAAPPSTPTRGVAATAPEQVTVTGQITQAVSGPPVLVVSSLSK